MDAAKARIDELKHKDSQSLQDRGEIQSLRSQIRAAEKQEKARGKDAEEQKNKALIEAVMQGSDDVSVDEVKKLRRNLQRKAFTSREENDAILGMAKWLRDHGQQTNAFGEF